MRLYLGAIGLVLFLLAGCGSGISEEGAKAQIEEQTQRILAGLNDALKESPQFTDKGSGAGGPYMKKISYDVRKTDSVVSPYTAAIMFPTRNVDGTNNLVYNLDWTVNYALQDGSWVLKDVSGVIGDIKGAPAAVASQMNGRTVNIDPHDPRNKKLLELLTIN